MRPLRYSINVTLDGCCDHRAILPDEELHRHATENLARAHSKKWYSWLVVVDDRRCHFHASHS